MADRDDVRRIALSPPSTTGDSGFAVLRGGKPRGFACACLNAGMSGFELMRLLGHAELDMTKRYLALTQADLQKAHRNASPVDRLG